MRLGVRGKLFAVSVVVILVVVGGSGLYLTSALRDTLEARIADDLSRHAQVAGELAKKAQSVEQLRDEVDRLGASSGLRTTVIAPDGVVIADSGVSRAELATLENHANRPEVAGALAEGRGQSRRASSTMDSRFEYIAIRFDGEGGSGVVRVAMPLSEVDESMSRLRWLVLVAGGLGLLIAVVMSALASHLMSRTLRSLVSSARTISDGDERKRINVDTRDELQGLAGSINQMAEEVESTVAELAKERALVKAVLKGMSEAVIALDRDRKVTLMNPAAAQLLGLDATPEGRSILEVLRVPALQELLSGDPREPGSTEFVLPNGRHVLARVRPQKGTEGSVLVMHDITDVRRLETVRRDFVANVSHELRTPVAIIRANAETLLEGALEDPKFGRSLIEALHRNAERLSNIIGDLLDLSRIEAGRYQLEVSPVAVADAAEHAAKSIERAAQEKDIAIEVAVDSGTWASADAKALEQVLFNLLDNAVKYTPEGGRIVISAAPQGEGLRIRVEDNGPGIEPRHRERVFERFYRVDPGRSRNMGGTGLGLAIVRHLVEAMGGKVSVTGARPQGSIFNIDLAAAKPTSPTVAAS